MLLEEIKKSSLAGRSGSRFPVSKKWESLIGKKGEKFIICNAAEGEPGVSKDRYLLEKEPERIVDGMEKAMDFLEVEEGFIYLKKEYHRLFSKKLKSLVQKKITLKLKEDKYIAGEETAAIKSIEGERAEPKIKPPYPTEEGLWGKPTLIHNVETFYAISEIASFDYKNERFYQISGEVKNEGIFKLSNKLTIREVLEKSGNYPNFEFLIQAGGGAGGVFFKEDEIDQVCNFLGSIKVFDIDQFDAKKQMKEISRFLMSGNCDRCVPCREGLYRIHEMTKSGYYDKKLLDDLILSLKKSSYCPLGEVAGRVFASLSEFYEN